uniref:Ribonuclease 4 n=1 Tax=Peromyscus maniculatus bairdii TaxID=230844 RepID=A0A8C8UJA8_PERMB
MALQRTQSWFLLLVLTLLGLGLVQPSSGQDRMYQRFLRQHVAPQDTGGDDRYCNVMMQRRKMTAPQCKRFNTFIHEDRGRSGTSAASAAPPISSARTAIGTVTRAW